MVPDVRNPPFPRAIPHAMVIIDLLAKVVIFGSFPGASGCSLGRGPRVPLGTIPGDA